VYRRSTCSVAGGGHICGRAPGVGRRGFGALLRQGRLSTPLRETQLPCTQAAGAPAARPRRAAGLRRPAHRPAGDVAVWPGSHRAAAPGTRV